MDSDTVTTYWAWGWLVCALAVAVGVAWASGRSLASGEMQTSDLPTAFLMAVCGAMAASMWPAVIAVAVAFAPFALVAWIASCRYTKGALRARETQKALQEKAKLWDAIAADDGQLEDTRSAALAAARALRGQANLVEVPKLGKQKKGGRR